MRIVIDELAPWSQSDYERVLVAVKSAPPRDVEMRSTKPDPNWMARFLNRQPDEPLWSLTPGSADEEETLP